MCTTACKIARRGGT
jgi:hypothetical protein